ncbi:MAG: glycosyltransferase, partial [Candidatus Eremiobacteraeota bacterium]|nr:glycosyltransferase [Candidatus Eremiobacteraeota bacterium]
MTPARTAILGALAPHAAPATLPRVSARGKFLYAGDEKLLLRGVTYGTFATDEQGRERHERAQVEADFAAMAANGFNAVRLYTVPERWVLDAALAHGLYVAVGLAWEQHLSFLDSGRFRAIERRVRAAARECAGHPAVFCYVVGNEIPAPIVRWYGGRAIERAIRRLYDAVKGEDPDALVTYVNYPTTEYLQLPFLDVVAFNVYLEDRERYENYLARLQNIALDRPLLIAELGHDGRATAEQWQATTLDWLVRSTFAAGCAGAFAFAWTDEWHRDGCPIEEWEFGLTRRDRSPKPALRVVRDAFAEAPFPPDEPLPRISVVVCAYNAETTIAQTLQALTAQRYPEFEPIVVDDGSTDRTAEIARRFPVRLIQTENRGLSSARNTGLEAATGE